MKLRYSYHSEHNADKQDRWFPFILLIGAIFLLSSGIQQLSLHFTTWSAADENYSWKHLVLGVIYLLTSGLITWFGWQIKNASRDDADRYVRISEEELVWDLTQVEGEQAITLTDIVNIERPNVRDLTLSLVSGEEVTFPIFLIANEEKQEELVKCLAEAIGKQG